MGGEEGLTDEAESFIEEHDSTTGPPCERVRHREAAHRMRYREGLRRKVLMEPSKLYEMHLTCTLPATTSHPATRSVSSSNFPRWSRNLNTCGNNFGETEWVDRAQYRALR